jgi:phage-related protein
MTLLKEQTRSKTGKSLSDYKTSVTNAVNQIKAIKSQLSTLLTDVNGDINGSALYYVSSDATDIQSVIDYLNSEVAAI